MIKSIKHKGLNNYWTKGQAKGINAQWLPKIQRVMNALNKATKPEDMNIPGYRFHGLSGFDPKRYAITITGNYRLTFAWDNGDATDIDLEDYH